jgi:hypothetical protein
MSITPAMRASSNTYTKHCKKYDLIVALSSSSQETSTATTQCGIHRTTVVEFGNYRRGKKAYIFGGIRPHQKKG